MPSWSPVGIALYLLLGLAGLFALSLTPLGSGFRRWMMAKAYAGVQEKYEPHAAARKRELLGDLTGTVLEIGPGTGVNFRYLPDGIRWIGIEPNPHMHAALREAAAGRGIGAEFRTVTTEGMVVDNDSVDVVLSTLVLCSVPDPARVVQDILRILKPGGRFVFLEHVAAPPRTWLRRAQRLAKPFWWYFADGCRPDRDLGSVIRDTGFADVTIEEYRMPPEAVPAVVGPHVAGVAIKTEDGDA